MTAVRGWMPATRTLSPDCELTSRRAGWTTISSVSPPRSILKVAVGLPDESLRLPSMTASLTWLKLVIVASSTERILSPERRPALNAGPGTVLPRPSSARCPELVTTCSGT